MLPEGTFLIDIEAADFLQRRAYRLNPRRLRNFVASVGPAIRLCRALAEIHDHIGRNRKLAPELADQILAHHAAESLFIGHFATLSQALN
jgi:hypothetical protein